MEINISNTSTPDYEPVIKCEIDTGTEGFKTVRLVTDESGNWVHFYGGWPIKSLPWENSPTTENTVARKSICGDKLILNTMFYQGFSGSSISSSNIDKTDTIGFTYRVPLSSLPSKYTGATICKLIYLLPQTHYYLIELTIDSSNYTVNYGPAYGIVSTKHPLSSGSYKIGKSSVSSSDMLEINLWYSTSKTYLQITYYNATKGTIQATITVEICNYNIFTGFYQGDSTSLSGTYEYYSTYRSSYTDFLIGFIQKA